MSEHNNPSNLAQEEKNQPSYFAIIPANVRYCKDLEPNAKLLYGELTALSNRDGYCWATNKYFADLYDVEIRSIQNWLESLQKNNFIEIKFESNSFGTKRRIYINANPQKNFTACKNLHGGVKENSWGGEKNFQPHIYSNNTTENVVAAAPEKGGSEIQFSKDDLYAMANKLRKDWTSQEIENSWTIYQQKTYPVTDAFAFIEGIIKKTRTLKSIKETKKCQQKPEIQVTTKEKSEIVNGNSSGNVTLAPVLAHFAALYSPKKPLESL